MNTKISVFLDTEVFESLNFNFNHPLIKRLIDFKKNHSISLLSTNITCNEIKNHILEKVGTLHEKTVNLHKNTPSPINDILKKNNHIIEIDDNLVETVKCQSLSDFDNFINTHFLKLDCYSISPETIFSKYFNLEAPFQNKKSKKHEFPDAFVFESLRNSLQKNEEMLIISRDPDFEFACKNESGFKYFKDLEEAFNYLYLTIFGNEYAIIHTFIQANKIAIKEKIKNILDNSEIIKHVTYSSDINSSECCIREIIFKDVEISDFNLIELTPLAGLVELTAKITTYIAFDLTTSLITSTFHDSASISKTISLSFQIYLSFDDNKKFSNLAITSVRPSSEQPITIFNEAELWDLYHRLTHKRY